jgi:hypothetical protein
MINQKAAKVTPGVIRDGNGLHRWVYEFSLIKNPAILITTWKVFMLGSLFPTILMFVLTLFDDGFVKAISVSLQVFAIVAVIMSVLVIIGYSIIVIVKGGKYCVVFEMNQNGINHIELQKEFKKSQTFAMLTVLAGIVAGNVTTTGAGLLAGSKQNLYSEFSKVKKIIVNKKKRLIYINGALIHNQVYADAEDFDYIKEYIISHCPKGDISYK